MVTIRSCFIKEVNRLLGEGEEGERRVFGGRGGGKVRGVTVKRVKGRERLV